MGLFSFLQPLNPTLAAEKLRDAAINLDITPAEVRIANSLGVEKHILVKERILFRIAFSETSVDFYYHRQDSDPRIRIMGEKLEKMFSTYIFGMPGVPPEIAAQLYARARRDYIMRQPNELAGRMLTSMFFGEYREVAPHHLLQFTNLVHEYAKSTMIQAIELAKKLAI